MLGGRYMPTCIFLFKQVRIIICLMSLNYIIHWLYFILSWCYVIMAVPHGTILLQKKPKARIHKEQFCWDYIKVQFEDQQAKTDQIIKLVLSSTTVRSRLFQSRVCVISLPLLSLSTSKPFVPIE